MLPEEFARLTTPFPEPHVLVSTTGEILGANRAARELLGLSDEPIPAGLRLHAFTADPPERLDDYLRSCARTGSAIPGALRVRTGDAEPRRYRCDAALVVGENPEAAVIALRLRPGADASGRFLLLNREIDSLSREVHERRRAEAALKEQATQLEELTVELEQTITELETQTAEANAARAAADRASRAKSEFLAVMSHELRTPLNAILGYSELLAAEVKGPLLEGQRQQLERIQRSTRHLMTLIEEILTFSRLEAGHERPRLESADLTELAREAAELIEPLAAERGLALALDVPDRPVVVETDPAKVRQILLNLLGNAVKFTETGEVRLTLRAGGETIVLEVEDSGIGIQPRDLERIFDPFTQLDSSMTRRTGGTGLGLPVSRGLARLLGGELTAHSTPREGSTFVLELPARPPAES